MEQQKVELSIVWQVPSDSVIITKSEYTNLKKQNVKGKMWKMADLVEWVGRTPAWIKTNILNKPKFKMILDAENGGCVFYPKVQGEEWEFLASKMIDFLDENFSEIMKEKAASK